MGGAREGRERGDVETRAGCSSSNSGLCSDLGEETSRLEPDARPQTVAFALIWARRRRDWSRMPVLVLLSLADSGLESARLS